VEEAFVTYPNKQRSTNNRQSCAGKGVSLGKHHLLIGRGKRQHRG
jgi:hypothetical protein